MKASSSLVMRLRLWAILALIIGIFLLDLLTPLQWADWVLYFVPIVLTLYSNRVYDSYHLVGLVTVLIIVGGYFHNAIDPMIAVFNRGLGICVLWGVAWLIVQQKSVAKRLFETEMARANAESHRESAVAARELAEASTAGAVHREAQTARELLMHRMRLESFIESAMDAVVTIDSDQRILLFNRAAQQMFHCSAREALGQSLDKFIPERFRPGHGHHVETFGLSGATTRKMGQLGTVLGVRAGGEEFPIEAAISHFTVEGDTYYTVVLRDITERKHAEQLLQQSEARYRRLVEVSPFAIFIHRGERIVFTNHQGLALLGASKDEDVTGRSLLDFVHPGDMDQVKHRIHRIVNKGEQVLPAEERFIRLDGTEVDVEVVAARFVDEEGVGVEVFLRDVTERKSLEEQLKKAERLAELGTLASGMAHEIGTPMNVILGRAEYLMDRVRDETVKKGLQTIVAQVERITRVMNQLLAFARRKPPERELFALREVIETSLEMFHERLAKSRVEVETQIDDSCSKVRADRDQMSQVLINLIMNAIHAMPEGGILRIGLSSEEELVKLTVADSGQGIPGDVVEKIFEPFFTTKEFGKGTGLGLTVVKGIIEEHQGAITVDSEEGKGTTFSILLPGNQESPV